MAKDRKEYMKEYHRKWREKNPDKEKEYRKRYWKKKLEKEYGNIMCTGCLKNVAECDCFKTTEVKEDKGNVEND